VTPPADFLPAAPAPAGDPGIDRWEISFVRSPAELVDAAKRAKPALLTLQRGPEQPLTARYALSAIGPAEAKWGKRIVELAGEALNRGLDPGAAVREAKLRVRDEQNAGSRRMVLPDWARWQLRGLP
jgi:hypothetical protein